MVPQLFKLVPSFTVAQNIVLGMEPRPARVLRSEARNAEVAALCERFGCR